MRSHSVRRWHRSGTRIAFLYRQPQSPLVIILEEYIMADKKKPTVKELPTKALPTKDADKIKGGRVNYNI